MIHKWEMALWAMIAGTTAMASCSETVPLYGILVDWDIDIAHDPSSEELDGIDADIPEDLLVEEDEDADDDAADMEDEG